MNVNIITRCTRPQLLDKVESSIIKAFITNTSISFNWIIIIDTSIVYDLNSEFLEKFSKYDLKFKKGIKGDFGHSFINSELDCIKNEDWVYILDDDNEMHESLINEFLKIKEKKFQGFIFSQDINYKDFTNLKIREGKPENVKVKKIDMAQFLLKKSLIGENRLPFLTYEADGVFIEKLFKENPKAFIFSDKILSYYNSLQTVNKLDSLPKIVSIGTEKKLESSNLSNLETTELTDIKTDESEVIQKIIETDPDCILTISESFHTFPTLINLSYDFRKRWIHLNNDNDAGEAAYSCAMNYILNSIHNELISVFTPIYNTGEKILRTYESLSKQSFNNWEWVIVNDSNNLETLKILEKIKDPRIKIFDFKEKSKGNIGEVKYRACSMSRGKYLVELDHDDYLLPHALEYVLESFKKYPDAGFVYSDCVEVDNNLNSLMYGETFAFGYGSYRDETHLGKNFKVANTPNINPVTIRHIVSSPNHLRAWKRDTYFSIGGHNRRLAIVDDYELIVRSFLNTKIVKIEKACYIQFYHGSNTQNLMKGDIQRRVRTISNFYNNKIKERFEELGKEDWAYGKNLLSLPKKNLEEENYVNYIL